MNKNILITGASQRIGKELSLYFAKMGWNIAVHFNKSKKQAIILKKEIEKYSVKCVCIQANLLDTKKIKKIITIAKKKLGSI
ncbi:MAG: SDR family NAD(P)-dependent oxidoreductase, partial [Proteobacteria bacterium]|nr:SDR family NAD(P)-dependent oxidoreductase [Pseudomonadota bacterium]